uniref:Ig-like domain-containing protein n=1 Tax=Callorhinchus milii TaxID=7868 RepID=A0A4W3GHW0_CALMI
MTCNIPNEILHSQILFPKSNPTNLLLIEQNFLLTCESSGFNLSIAHMSWYRQLPGKQQENLLQYEGSSIKSFGSGFENRVIVIREDSQSIFDLIIKCPTVHDTSTYYCEIKTQ